MPLKAMSTWTDVPNDISVIKNHILAGSLL